MKNTISWGREVVGLVVSVALAQLAGAIGSLFTISSIPTWYATLSLPTWRPPNSLFGPVWITLYTLMGIAAYLVWRHDWLRREGNRGEVRRALWIYAAQLVVNALWSIVFFGAQSIGGGLIVIIVLWLLIAATIIAFKKISMTAAWLLVPYLLWVSFATILNLSIWMMN